MLFSNRVEDFLKVIQLGVVSSIGPDRGPQSAVVGVTSLIDTGELIIGTSVKSRKYRNIKNTPNVSLAMWHDNITVQCDGKAEVLERTDPRFMDYQSRIIELQPAKAKYADDPDQVWMVFKPSWIRYTDTGVKPWLIEENKY